MNFQKKNQDNVKLLTLLVLWIFDCAMHEGCLIEACRSSIVAVQGDQDLGN